MTPAQFASTQLYWTDTLTEQMRKPAPPARAAFGQVRAPGFSDYPAHAHR